MVEQQMVPVVLGISASNERVEHHAKKNVTHSGSTGNYGATSGKVALSEFVVTTWLLLRRSRHAQAKRCTQCT